MHRRQDSAVQIASGINWTHKPNGNVGIGIVPGHSLELNETGSLLWIGIIERLSEDALIASLQSEFDVPVETARTDLTAFLNNLEENLLLER
jgi:hypothetical protein